MALKYLDATESFSKPLQSSNLSTKSSLTDSDTLVLAGGGGLRYQP